MSIHRAHAPGIVGQGGGAPPPPSGPIAFVGQSAAYVASAAANVHTFSYTAATSGANRKLIVVIAIEFSSPSIASVTYNGQALTLAVGSTNGSNRATIWYLDHTDLPTDGLPHNVQITLGGSMSDYAVAGVIEYNNVAQGAAEDTDATTASLGNPASGTVTSTAGALVVDCAACNVNTTYTPGAGQTERFDVNGPPDTQTLAASDKIGVSAGSVPMSQDPGSGATAYAVASWAKAA